MTQTLREPSDTLMLPSQRICENDFAVIDIGSNSVRLVIYAYPKRLPVVKMNVKELVGLGRGLDHNNMICAKRGAHFLSLVSQFRLLIDKTGVRNVKAVGTAALRDAANGDQYLNKAIEILGCDIDLLSGDDEARFAAYGILMGWPQASGVLADLGGGSLELALIENGAVKDTATFPLGVLRLRGFKNIKKETRAILNAQDVTPYLKKPLFLIGGSWRSLAKVDLAHNAPHEKILHGYEMSAPRMKAFCNDVQDFDERGLEALSMLSENRRVDIVYGAALLKILLKELKAPKVTFSSYGLREGLLYDALPEHMQGTNLLDFHIRDRRLRKARDPNYFDELMATLGEIFALYDVSLGSFYARVMSVSAELSDTYWHIHPDHRHEWAYYSAMNNPAFAFARKRNLTALILALRYKKSLNSDMMGLFQSLGEEDQLFCTVAAALLRALLDTTKGVSGLFSGYRFTLHSEGGKVLKESSVAKHPERVQKAILRAQSAPELPIVRDKSLESVHQAMCAFKYFD